MKKKSIIGLFIGLMGFGSMATSCEDMLTPEMDRYAQNFSGRDTVNFYLGIMANLQEMVEQNVILGEVRADLVDTTMYSSDSISDIANFRNLENGENALLNRSAYYKVINQCNYYLDKVDSLAKKNNIYYMRKEMAQVLTIRAWTYMQLVQNYGEVPFITKPIDNANTGWETSSPEGTVTPITLLDKVRQDMLQAISYEAANGYPSYGNFNTGSTNVSSSIMIFPANLVLADLYLLRGNGEADYINAAKYYYDYLKDTKTASLTSRSALFNKTTMNGSNISYDPSYYSWLSEVFYGVNYTPTLRSMVAIPSAANSSFGKVLTRLPQLCGFDVTSRNSTDVDDSGDDETITTSGSISLTANPKTRQIGPSQAYSNLNKAQLYKETTLDESQIPTNIEYYTGAGDARQWASAPYVYTDEGMLRFIQKYGVITTSGEATRGNQGTFRYVIPVYRNELVYLRFAEAINRAGFPRHAFAILRNGLSSQTMPKLLTASKLNSQKDSVILNDQGKWQKVYYLDSARVRYGCDYVGVDELRRAQAYPWLDFSASTWASVGIHGNGTGTSYDNDTLYTYDEVVADRVDDEYKRSGLTFSGQSSSLISKRDAGDGGEEVEPGEPGSSEDNPIDAPLAEADPAEINAVETLIADEMALETAFEGNRYYDLMRMARHKDNVIAGYGTEWFAWLISRRSMNVAPYGGDITAKGPLYGTLTSTVNWYLPNPVY